MNDKIAALDQKLQTQIDRINEVIAKTRQNELVDISDMDATVASLCQSIIHSEDDEVSQLEGKMIQMINLLDELSVELKEYQDRAKPEG